VKHPKDLPSLKLAANAAFKNSAETQIKGKTSPNYQFSAAFTSCCLNYQFSGPNLQAVRFRGKLAYPFMVGF